MNRTIFPNLKLFKKTVLEHFLITLQEIYKNHPVYKYKAKPDETNIHIVPTYADVTYESKVPRLLVKVGGYNFSLQDTLYQNMSGDIRNELGVLGGFESMKDMSVNVMVYVRAFAEEESSDIADELSMLSVYAAHSMFTQMGIDIRGSQVSETRESDTNNDFFETVIQFPVLVRWELAMINEDDAIDPNPGVEVPKTPTGYIPPGVETHRKRKDL